MKMEMSDDGSAKCGRDQIAPLVPLSLSPLPVLANVEAKLKICRCGKSAAHSLEQIVEIQVIRE